MDAKSPKIDELPDDVDALKALVAELDAKIASQRLVIEHLRHIAFGKKSERRPCPEHLVEASGQGHPFHADLLAEAERRAKARRVQGAITLDPPEKPAPRRSSSRRERAFRYSRS